MLEQPIPTSDGDVKGAETIIQDASHAIPFADVLHTELHQIADSRQGRLPNIRREEFLRDMRLVGLALSGGGVRSATFSLGVLQGLARVGLLRHLDLLSSTGGGAEIAGWFLRWIHGRGFREVEEQLGGKDVPRSEAPEIQGLRRTIALTKRRSKSIAIVAGLGNVLLNLLALGTLLASGLLLTRVGLEKLASLRFIPDAYPVLILATALLLGLPILKRSPACPPSQLRTVFIAVVLSVFAALVVREGMATPVDFSSEWRILTVFAIAFFSLILGLELQRPFSGKKELAFAGAALLVGTIGIGLIGSFLQFLLPILIPPTFTYEPGRFSYDLASYQWSTYVLLTQFAVAAVILLIVGSLAVFAMVVKKSLVRGTRELFWRVCRTLIAFAVVLFTAAFAWTIPSKATGLGIVVAAVLTIPGLLRGIGVHPKSSIWKSVLEVFERVAPATFLIAFSGIVAVFLMILTQPYRWVYPSLQMATTISLAVISLLLLWLIRARELTAHHVHRAAIVRKYLTPAANSAGGDADTSDVNLSSFAVPQAEGPYPLFNSALYVTEIGSESSVPFLFSPIVSGFELPTIRDSRRGVSDAYRPTGQLAGGISLATAIAISEPIHGRSFQPPSGATSLLWTIFNLRDGRFIGNPLQDHTWREKGPLIEPLYALREGDLATEMPFVRPSPSESFDYLGIYQLVKRRCHFIIACDATNDPDFAFEELGKTIRRCRTDLGVEIQMDLGPLGRTPATSHFQIAQIKYDGEDGFMVYIKPTVTWDEPTELVQYARAHPEFPATAVAGGRFGESDFESYRWLAQHIVESVFADIQIPTKASTNEVISLIRGKLQPGYVESKKTSTADSEAAVVISPELVDAIASGECVLCTGYGLAAQAKLPTWPALLDGLLRRARDDRFLDAATANGLSATLSAGEFEAAADELTHQVSRDLVLSQLRSVTSGPAPSEAHEALAEMKFLGALSLSIDELVATAFRTSVLVPSQADKLVRALQSRKFFVANLFGTVQQPSSLLFTMKEFRHLLLANSQVKQFLGTLFLRYTIVFVGMGMDGLRDFMEALELSQTPDRKHYAILPNAAQIDPVKARFFERSYNIRVVDYQPQFNYEGLPIFLKKLQQTVQQNLPQPKATGPSTLKSVALENIGPFHSLEVEFTPQWNLLLGDNGVGKTVLLKAIAAALCGDKTDPEAVARLLRVGAPKGSITLRDENREYVVELERRVDGSVHIVSASLSPIIYDRWLVLGFPALRSIPLTKPKGPGPLRPEAPSAEDLLPLLRGEVDDRGADIKQWLVNLDYATKSESQDLRARARGLTRDFYKVLQRLTHGLRLDPGAINQRTFEITVVTDSGTVPLEFVSQGTGAVMCWIGTLLERLSETGAKSALVLIDELDAHMHPKWQQAFVDAFRKEFTSVQIIATTHSPLLIGSLKPNEVHLVQRAPLKSDIYGQVHMKNIDDETREIIVVAPGDDSDGTSTNVQEERRYRVSTKVDLLVKEGEVVEEFEPMTKDSVASVERVELSHQGWRADQILTSPLFQLQTTRDPETANLISEYTRLAALSNPSEEDIKKLSEVADQLQVRTATPKEQHAARIAYSLIEDFATSQLRKLPEPERQKILDEVKVQLTESITGSRRPE